MAIASGIPPPIKFTQKISRYTYVIVNQSCFQIHNSKIKGMNSKIKTIKRKAFSFNDIEYFKLIIEFAFI